MITFVELYLRDIEGDKAEADRDRLTEINGTERERGRE